MMLDVQGLKTAYGRIPILHGVTFAVNDGEFVGILGDVIGDLQGSRRRDE